MSDQELPKTGLMRALEAYDSGDKVRALAESVNRSESTVFNWKSGARQPGKKLLLELAPRLGLTPEEALAPAGRAPEPAPLDQHGGILGTPLRREIHSMVRGRLKLLAQDEVMFVRLDGDRFDLSQDAVLMIKEVLGDGHVIVARVLARPGPELERKTSGGSKAPIGRQHTGKARGLRRQPIFCDQGMNDEDRDDLPSREDMS